MFTYLLTYYFNTTIQMESANFMRKCTYPVSFVVRSMPLILVVGCSMPPNALGIEHTRTETGSVHFHLSPRNF